jgi:hypothetical protein
VPGMRYTADSRPHRLFFLSIMPVLFLTFFIAHSTNIIPRLTRVKISRK